MNQNSMVSAVVPVSGRYEKSGALAREYLDALNGTGRDFELVFVLDGKHAALAGHLLELAANDRRVRIIQLAKVFGESTAIAAGIENTAGAVVLTLPAYYQIDATEISKLINELESSDMAVAARWPRAAASKFEVLRRRAFHWLVSKVSRTEFTDLGCGARAFKRVVADEVPVYGDQHRFIPLLALRRGFRVHAIQVGQSEGDWAD